MIDRLTDAFLFVVATVASSAGFLQALDGHWALVTLCVTISAAAGVLFVFRNRKP